MKLKYLKLITVVFFLFSLNVFAQYGSIGSVNARSMGLGKTYTAVSSGVQSIGLNPANLISEDTLKFQIATVFPVPAISAITGSDVLSLDDFNYFFGGVKGASRILDEADKKRLNDIFSSGGFLFADGSLQLLNVGFIPDKRTGAFGFAITDFTGAKIHVPQQLVDLVLNGNPVGKVFDFSSADIQAWWIRNYSFSYARKIDQVDFGFLKNFTAGISLKLVQGFAYASTGRTDLNFSTSSKNELQANTNFEAFSSFADNFGVKYDFDSLDHNSHFELFPGPAGTGFGLDLGFTFTLLDRALISAAITDIGSISWSKNTARFSNNESLLLDDITDKAKIDSLVDLITANSEPAGEFTTGLATAFRFGLAFLVSELDDGNLPGHLLLAADYNQGFNNLPGNSTSPRFSFGVEWGVFDFLPLVRTGFEYSEVQGFNWSFGLGFITSLVDVDLATNSVHTAFFPGSYSSLSLSLSSRWKFN